MSMVGKFSAGDILKYCSLFFFLENRFWNFMQFAFDLTVFEKTETKTNSVLNKQKKKLKSLQNKLKTPSTHTPENNAFETGPKQKKKQKKTETKTVEALTNKIKWRNQTQISPEINHLKFRRIAMKTQPLQNHRPNKTPISQKTPKPRHKEDIRRGHSKGGGSKCAGDLGHPSINCEDPTREQNKHRGRNRRFIVKPTRTNGRKKKERKQKNQIGKQTVKNLSNSKLSDNDYILLGKGLKFCPKPKSHNKIKLAQETFNYTRRLRLQEYFYENNSEKDESMQESDNYSCHSLIKNNQHLFLQMAVILI